ncbi:hypothetical protein Mro02_47670 [Microbispora rosea subsp. aerata]|nr:hypothetical protein Mro02_47670 [Microbispora rosea subsp. aerata]
MRVWVRRQSAVLVPLVRSAGHTTHTGNDTHAGNTGHIAYIRDDTPAGNAGDTAGRTGTRAGDDTGNRGEGVTMSGAGGVNPLRAG